MLTALHASALLASLQQNFSGLRAQFVGDALTFINRPDFAVVAIILAACSPLIFWVEIKHAKLRLARSAEHRRDASADTFKAYQDRLNYRTWNAPQEIDSRNAEATLAS